MNKQSPTTVVVMPTMLAIAALNKGIDDICRDASDIQTRIGEIGVQCLLHLEKSGDIGPVNRLMVGLPKGVRRNALGSWLLTHGSLEVNPDAGTKKSQPVKFARGKKTNVAAAMADPWYSHQPEKPLDTVFDLQRAIHVLLTRAKGKTIKVHGKDLSTQDANDRLKALAAMVGEEFIAEPTAAKAMEKVGEASM
jgi:hypothetical protein